MIHQFLNKDSKTNWGYIIGYFILFLIAPPFIAIPTIIVYMVTKSHATKSDYYLCFFAIAGYFAAINATKRMGGDQWQYYVAYMNVPDVGFWKSLVYIYGIDYFKDSSRMQVSGEFMNGIYNYLGYYLTFGYYPLYAALLTFMDYLLVFLGLRRFCLSMKKPHIPIIAGIFTLSFFYLFFSIYLANSKAISCPVYYDVRFRKLCLLW